MAKEKLEIDVVANTSKAQKGFKDLASTAEQTGTRIGKSFAERIGGGIQKVADKVPGLNKVLGSGVADAASIGAGAIAGFATAGASAIVGFATKSIGAFESLGVSVGKFRDATGVTAEQASRLIEVAGDVGISADTVQSAIGKMNKAVAASPAVFQQLGINIAYAKDGTVDANQTFLNTVDVLSKIEDPTKRAAAASAIFGKSYQDMSELIFNGSGKVKAALAGVEQQKIFDDAKIEKARKLRASFDDLHDSVEDLEYQLASGLAPAIATIAEAASKVIGYGQALGGVQDSADKAAKGQSGFFGGLLKVSNAVSHAVEDTLSLDSALKHHKKSTDDSKKSTDDATASTDDQSKALQQQSTQWAAAVQGMNAAAEAQQAIADAKPAEVAQELADADKAAADAANDLADAQNKAASAILDRIDAQRAATDDVYALKKADDDFGKSLGAVGEAQQALADANNKTDYKDQAEKTKAVAEAFGKLVDSQEAARQSAVDLADQVVKTAQDQAVAEGRTVSATQKIDLQNASLLKSAATAKGPVRDAIIGYIGQLNHIPPEKVAEIKALLDQGKVAEAERVIDQTSRTRSVAMNADAHTADAERDLNYAARTRVAHIEAALTRGGNQTTDAKSIQAAGGWSSGGRTLVGEQGPELVEMPAGAFVHTAPETKRILGGGNTTNVTNVTVHYPAGADPARYRQEQRRNLRRNGS